MPADDAAVAIAKRYDVLFAEQSMWRNFWQELADFYLPRKAEIIRMREQGARRDEMLFNSAGGRALTRLASNMNGALTSMAFPWFSWIAEEETVNEHTEAAQWFEACTNRGYRAFASDECNFYTQAHEHYIDLGGFGTAATLFEGILEPNGAFRHFAFKTLQIGSYVIDENQFGLVDLLMRRFQMSARNAAQRFGEDNLSDELMKMVKEKPDSKHEFIHAVLPRVECIHAGYNPKDIQKNWGSIWIEMKTRKTLSLGGFNEFPYLVSRWLKTSGETYGRCPAMEALPDIKTLNRATELKLEAWGLALRPPMVMDDDGVIGDVDLTPGGITIKRKGSELAPLFSGSDFKVAEIEEERILEAINGTFFVMDFNLPLNKDMTIPEVDERINERNQLVGPVYSRLQQEWLGPLTKRAFNILLTAREFPEMPEVLSEQKYTVRYEGPLARAQRAVIVDNIMRTRQAVSMIAQINPAVLDNFNDDEEARIIADAFGYPKKALRSVDEVQETRGQRNQMQTLEKIAGAAQPVTQAVKNLADAKATATEAETAEAA